MELATSVAMVRYREEFSRLGGDGLSFDDWGKVEEIDGKIQKDKQYKKLRKAVKSHESKMIAAEKRLSEAQSAAREKLVKAIDLQRLRPLRFWQLTARLHSLLLRADELGEEVVILNVRIGAIRDRHPVVLAEPNERNRSTAGRVPCAVPMRHDRSPHGLPASSEPRP